LISIKGLTYVLSTLDKTTIDQYLLSKGYTFKQQYVEPEDQSYFPKPLRHLYENTSTNISVGIAYFGLRAFEITVASNDPNIYLNLKNEAVKDGYTVKNTGEQEGATWMHYILAGKGINMTFKQRNLTTRSKYLIIFSDDNIGNEASTAVLKDMQRANAAANNSTGGKDSVKTDSVRTIPQPTDTVFHHHASASSNRVSKVYNFPSNVLYPDDNGINLNETHFAEEGVITGVNFESNVFRITDTSGESLDIQFYPNDASAATYNDLRLALKAGNKIKSICARAGAATLDLYSAKIYVSSK
jgi:hypothetical protein